MVYNYPRITIHIQVESNLEEQPENEGTPAEEQPGEEYATQEETQENSGEEVAKKPPNIDCEEVHNNDGESGEALQPSMTNVGTLMNLKLWQSLHFIGISWKFSVLVKNCNPGT